MKSWYPVIKIETISGQEWPEVTIREVCEYARNHDVACVLNLEGIAMTIMRSWSPEYYIEAWRYARNSQQQGFHNLQVRPQAQDRSKEYQAWAEKHFSIRSDGTFLLTSEKLRAAFKDAKGYE